MVAAAWGMQGSQGWKPPGSIASPGQSGGGWNAYGGTATSLPHSAYAASFCERSPQMGDEGIGKEMKALLKTRGSKSGLSCDPKFLSQRSQPMNLCTAALFFLCRCPWGNWPETLPNGRLMPPPGRQAVHMRTLALI